MTPLRHKMIESVFATGIPFGGGKYLPATLQDLARLMPACVRASKTRCCLT